MSFEKSQCNQGNKKIDFVNLKNDENNINNIQETNLLLKPIAIKQNIITNNQSNKNNLNKYPTVSVIYPNKQTQYLNEINQINYSKKDSFELINYNSNEFQIQNTNNNEKGAFSSFTNYKNNNNNNPNNIINNNNPNNTINNNNIKNELSEQNNKIHCTCKKTKCIKKYCECFSSGILCFNCKCENCENKTFFTDNINRKNSNNINNINKIEEEIKEKKESKQINEANLDLSDNNTKKLIICTCSKSGCNKNYCECFKAKVKCNNKCRCIKCLNKPDDSIQLDEEKIIGKSISTPINNNNKIDNNIPLNSFTVHRISVNINKAQTLINTEKLDYFDSNKFLSKKRNEN